MAQERNYCVSTRVHYGLGSLDYLSELKVKRALVVSDHYMVESGMIKKVCRPLEEAEVEYQVFSDVISEPNVSVIVKGVDIAQNFSPHAIIAFGGGCAIDTAKGILFLCNRIKGTERVKPDLIIIPTTSDGDSEAADFAIITDERIDLNIIDPKLMPNHAILDASLLRSLPPSVTADTGFDILTHALEAYVSTRASDFTDALAEKAIKLVFEYLPKAYRDRNDDEARIKLHNASALAGKALTHTSLGINHSMAHALGGRFRIPHGRANGILLPYVIDYNCKEERIAERYAEISKLLGLNFISPKYAAKELRNMVRNLQGELDMPTCFKDTGIDEAEFWTSIESLAFMAMKDPCTSTNPRYPCQDDLENLFQRAYYGK